MFKFNEDKLLKEYEEYVKSTYNQHYSDEDGLQTIEKIRPRWREGFMAGNLQKYIDRPEKGSWRKDLFKVCLLYTSPSPRDRQKSRMPSSA